MLEMFTAFVHVSDGAAESGPAPGVAVLEAPRRADRVRLRDRLFVLVELNGAGPVAGRVYRELVALTGESYFQSSGSVTSGLRKAILAANDRLFVDNSGAAPGTQITGGLVCAVARPASDSREMQLFVAHAGVGVAYLAREGLVDRFPPAAGNGEEDDAPLGVTQGVGVHFTQESVTTGDVLFLSESRVVRLLTDARVGDMIADARAEDVAQTLHNRVRDSDYAALVVEFGKPVAEAGAAAGPAGKARAAALPASKAAASGSRPPARQAPAQAGALAAEPEEQEEAPGPAEAAAGARPGLEVGERLGGVSRALMLGVSKVAGGAGVLLARTLPEPAQEQRPLLGQKLVPVWVVWLSVVLVPLLVATITVTVWLQRGQAYEAGESMNRARAELVAARQAGDGADAVPHYENVLDLLTRAKGLGAGGQEWNSMHNEAQSAVDHYYKVTRLEAKLLRDFGEGSKPSRILFKNLDAFTLDAGGNRVYADDLNDGITGLRGTPADALLTPAYQVNERRVTHLVDLAWLPAGLTQRDSQVLALDAKGVLFSYTPGFGAPASGGWTATPLVGASQWSGVTAMTTYLDRLYLLDPGANQLWRYEPSLQGFNQPPSGYFPQGSAAALANVIDVSIDTSGRVYLLRSDGTVSKYVAGGAETFSITGVPDAITAPSTFFIGPDPLTSSIYVAEPRAARIVRLGQGGNFLDQYRVDGDAFDHITGLYVDESKGRFFVASGTKLYVAYSH